MSTEQNAQVEETKVAQEEVVQPTPPARKKVKKFLQTEEIDVEDENGNIVDTLVVSEMTQLQKEQWQTESRKRVMFDKQGNPLGWSNFQGSAAELFTRCVRHKISGKVVTEIEVRGWGVDMCSAIGEVVSRLNGLAETPEKQEETGKKS